MPFVDHNDVSIHYEQYGSGFPVLLIAPGGLSSTIDRWYSSARINPLTEYQGEFGFIAMDQRNAGLSRGPFPTVDPWRAYVNDQLSLMDYLGVDRFMLFGCCIGCSFALKMAEVAPDRMSGAVLEQPMGSANNAENQHHWKEGRESFVANLLVHRLDLNAADGELFGRTMLEDDSYFVFSVSRDDVKECRTPMVVLPGTNMPHPHEIGVEISQLAPNASLIDPWQSPPAAREAAVSSIRSFMHAYAN